MPNNLRHDLDYATPEEQAIHLALQREIEMDLTGYATEKWVKAQGYVQKPQNLLGNPPPAPEPELPEPAPRLPGFTWNYKEYADEGSAPVTSGEFTWDKEESTFYISCISGCGVLLGKQQSSFNDFITQALMTIYDQDLGLCALVQVLRIEIKSYAGQHYFKILRGGQARQTLSTGKSYNITLSGVF